MTCATLGLLAAAHAAAGGAFSQPALAPAAPLPASATAVSPSASPDPSQASIAAPTHGSDAAALADHESDPGGALSVSEQQTGCGEGALFVRWRLSNARPTARRVTLRAALSPLDPEGPPIVSEPQTIELEAGADTSVAFRFPRDGATETARVRLGVRLPNARYREVYEAPARYPCLRDCPAMQVVVRRGAVDPNDDDDDSVCPARDAWRGSIASRDSDRTYCSYEWDRAGEEPDLDRFADVGADDWEKDCLDIGAQGNLTLDELARATDARLGIDDRNAIAASGEAGPLLEPAQRVRLSVVDTAAHRFEDTSADDTSDHGRVVGLTARRTACGDARDCAVRIDNQPALRVEYADAPDGTRRFRIDGDNGGYIGSRGHIARGIHRALRNWDPERERLVINLSLAWHAKLDCPKPGCGEALDVDLPSPMLVPSGTAAGYASTDGDGEGHGLGTRAVLLAIARARCMGALVFAAVGNAVAGDDELALLPAAWNDLDASRIDCRVILQDPAATGHPTGGLVKAVAAVNFEGRRVALSRKRALPFLVAHGVGLSVHDTRPRARRDGGITGPLSGSSLATAVVSGAAAELWALAGPSATAEDIFEALYNAGTPMLGNDGEPPPESDLCGRRDGAGCRVPHEIDACTPLHAHANLSAARALDAEAGISPAALAALQAAADRCTAERQLPTSGEPESSTVGEPDAEAEQLEAFSDSGRIDVYEAPYCQPQPGPIQCATCALYRNVDFGDYRINFADAFSEDGSAIASAFVKIHRDGAQNIPLSSSFITASGRLRGLVDLSSFDVGTSPVSLTVEFPPTPQGIPISATELIDTLIAP